jgi:hypothetical protein
VQRPQNPSYNSVFFNKAIVQGKRPKDKALVFIVAIITEPKTDI